MYKIDAIVFKGEKDWTKVLDGYEIIFLEVTGFDRFEDIPVDCDKTMKYCMKKFLKTKERKVLYLRYFGKLTYKNIAERLGLCQERARQIKEQAIRTLRTPMCNKILRYGMGKLALFFFLFFYFDLHFYLFHFLLIVLLNLFLVQ